MGNNVGDWLEASVRCVAAIRPESEVKPTYRHRSIDAIDPTETSEGLGNATRTLAAITLGALADR